MSDQMSLLVGAAVAAAFLLGLYFERARARLARKRWQARRNNGRPGRVVPFLPHRGRGTAERGGGGPPPPGAFPDAADQLRLVMGASFRTRKLLNGREARVFEAAEKCIRDKGLPWRVMAQVSLGEILSSPDERAYGAINSKRVDVLLVTEHNAPLAAIEYQGDGHYQGTAPARDAVKKEALRKAGIAYIEITTRHAPKDLCREIERLAAGSGTPQPHDRR